MATKKLSIKPKKKSLAEVHAAIFGNAEARRSSEYWDFFRDGITVSGLEIFLACREQFRLKYVEGYQQKGYKQAAEFGDLFHWLIQRRHDPRIKNKGPKQQIKLYERQWLGERGGSAPPAVRQMQDMNYLQAEAIWPVYVDTYPDDDDLEWLELEGDFSVKIPYGSRKVLCRGIMDGVFRQRGIVLEETKTKSRIDEQAIEDTLAINVQVMVYLLVLWFKYGEHPRGCRYNVIAKPSTNPWKTETLEEYKTRLNGLVEMEPEKFFKRWIIEVKPYELDNFYKYWFCPVMRDLEEWAAGGGRHYMNPTALLERHYRPDMYEIIVRRNELTHFERRPKSSRLVER